jgi:hypothetical protein
VPLGGGKRDMGGGEDRDKMVFSGPDGPFGLVSPVVGGRDVLNLDGGGRLHHVHRRSRTTWLRRRQLPANISYSTRETTHSPHIYITHGVCLP